MPTVPPEDFENFKPLFDRVVKDLGTGARKTRQIRKDAGFLKTDIKKGEFFILNGQTLYIAEVGETIKAPKRKDLLKGGRCRLHGGLSTGPKTLEGKRRSALNTGRTYAGEHRLLKINLSGDHPALLGQIIGDVCSIKENRSLSLMGIFKEKERSF